MIAYFLLGVGLLIGLLVLIKWASETEPRKLLRTLGWTLGVLGLVLGLLLLWVGRYQFAWIALPALFGLLSRWRQIRSALRGARRAAGGGGRGGSGQTSQVQTRFLDMNLEHDTGVMSGVVREGTYAGQKLEQLTLDDLLRLWREVSAADAQSATVLEAYLDKTHGETWREAAESGASGAHAHAGRGPAHAGAMDESEALEILGLEPGAGPDEVRKAYRQLMQKLHPDHGGSDWFAAKLNEAKRILIGD